MILLVGGAGFVGHHTMKGLLETGYTEKDIVVFDNFSWGKPDHIPKGIKTISGDITKPDDIENASKDIETIYHLAAIKEIPYSVKFPVKTHEVNVGGVLNTLEAARKSGAKKVIYSSAASVYGKMIYSPIDENHPTNPESPYAATKVCGEKYCVAYHHTYGLSTICLRYANVYGPNVTSKNVIDAFVENALKGMPLKLNSGGTQKKQFTHVSDISQANILALKTHVKHGIYNTAGDEKKSLISIEGLAKLVQEIVADVPIEYMDKRQGDLIVPDLMISIEKARNELGYSPKISIREGVKEYADWKRKSLGR